MNELSCARSSAATLSSTRKPFLRIADICATPGFDQFLVRSASNPRVAAKVVELLNKYAYTHTLQRDLWLLLQRARKTTGQ